MSERDTLHGFLTCELCYHVGLDVAHGLALYRDAGPAQAMQNVDRCTDHEACRGRVEARSDRWPLRVPGETPAVEDRRRRREMAGQPHAEAGRP